VIDILSSPDKVLIVDAVQNQTIYNIAKLSNHRTGYLLYLTQY